MTRDEFIGLHGEQAWERLVWPMQENGSGIQRNNANIIVHHDVIMPVLKLLGISAPGLLRASEFIK
jgi:hypothetical protein